MFFLKTWKSRFAFRKLLLFHTEIWYSLAIQSFAFLHISYCSSSIEGRINRSWSQTRPSLRLHQIFRKLATKWSMSLHTCFVFYPAWMRIELIEESLVLSIHNFRRIHSNYFKKMFHLDSVENPDILSLSLTIPHSP